MTADEIRNWPITDKGLAFNEPHRVAIDQAEFLRELASQVAEFNESRKPRWVNLSSTPEPWLVDATQVIGLTATHAHNNAGEYVSVVYIRIRGLDQPYTVWNMDHDEVRFKLGIDEDWIQAPRYQPPDTLNISKDEWDSARKVVEVARSVVGMLPDSKKNELSEAVLDFDNFQMPF